MNEINSLPAWLESLSNQTRQPDELVIIDGGSTDGSLELLRSYTEKSVFPVTIISEPGANIARGRNLAIQNAQNEVIIQHRPGLQAASCLAGEHCRAL